MTVVNRWYPAGLAAVGAGDIDLTGDVLNVQLVGDDYTFDAAHDDMTDLASAVIGDPAPVAGTRSMIGGTLVTDTAVTTIADVPADADEVAAVVLFHDSSGVPLAIWQRQGDTTEIVVVTDGGDIEVEFTLAATGGATYQIVRI